MDVGMISQVVSQNATLSTKTTAQSKAGAAAEQGGQVTDSSQAYSLDISAAQTASQAIKGLTSDQIDTLQQGIDKSYQIMIQTMTEQNLKLQGWMDQGIGQLNFGGLMIDTSKFALPAVATTPEEAQQAVSDGGDWSVNAVAGRIFDMATAIAGNDTTKLQSMQAAIEKGFEQAGLSWKDATGDDSMPQITQDTHDAITKKFTDLYAQLNSGTTDTSAADTDGSASSAASTAAQS